MDVNGGCGAARGVDRGPAAPAARRAAAVLSVDVGAAHQDPGPAEAVDAGRAVHRSGYMRHNITEDVGAEIFDVHQSTISRYITLLTPLIDQATAGFRPSAQEAAEATRDAIALLDGTLWPCWS